MHRKKILFIVIGCIIGLLFILLIPKGVDSIQNVVVNPENGDIAYVSFNNEYSVIYLVVFDSLGNELFSETLDSGGGGTQAYLVYKGNTLNICSGRKKLCMRLIEMEHKRLKTF